MVDLEQTDPSLEVVCLNLAEEFFRHIETYVVLLNKGKYLIDNVTSIFNDKEIGRDGFVQSPIKEGKKNKKYKWFVLVKIPLQDKLFPFFEINQGSYNSIYDMMVDFHKNNEHQIDFVKNLIENKVESLDYKKQFSKFYKIRFSAGSRREKQFYRIVQVKDNEVVEKLGNTGPGIKKYYYIQVTTISKEEEKDIYINNFIQANFLGYRKLGEIKITNKGRMVIWALNDNRLNIYLQDSGTEKGLCPKIEKEVKPDENVTVFNKYAVTEIFISKEKECSKTDREVSLAPVYGPDLNIIQNTDDGRYNIRYGTFSVGNLYLCQKIKKVTQGEQFISYRYPPIIIEDINSWKGLDEYFGKNFYICSHGQNKKDTTDNLRKYSSGNAYLCLKNANSNENNDPGIKSFYIYKADRKLCDSNASVATFSIDKNIECICFDLLYRLAGHNTYICFEKNTIY